MRWRSAKLQNIALLVSSFLLAVIALEISLRLAGALFLFTQECRNRVSLHRKDTYRILCLGESTTAGAYPAFLEEALNRRNLGTRFTIIDKGMPAINTSVIVARLGYELNRYHPDMVITMMGINDTGVHMPYEFDSGSGIGRVWKSMRVYKLAKLLWLHTAVKIRQINACRLYRPQACAQALQPVARDEAGYIDLGMRLAQEGKSVEAEAAYKQALQLNPRSDRACFELGRLYRDAGDFLTAEALFKQVLQLNPGHDEACVELGWLYKQEGDISQAESWFNKALHLNHNSDRACFG
ncbi:MAG TPA: tetratricopeptide repeat protein, partial [Patescibacteria group bacterium]|nr:tetratricopeptide repeat protein [Patescibacteria group bacterium]